MSEKVSVKIAIQGDGVATKEYDEGTTLGELKKVLEINPGLEYRVSSNLVDDEYELKNGDTLVGAQDAKGGV